MQRTLGSNEAKFWKIIVHGVNWGQLGSTGVNVLSSVIDLPCSYLRKLFILVHGFESMIERTRVELLIWKGDKARRTVIDKVQENVIIRATTKYIYSQLYI